MREAHTSTHKQTTYFPLRAPLPLRRPEGVVVLQRQAPLPSFLLRQVRHDARVHGGQAVREGHELLRACLRRGVCDFWERKDEHTTRGTSTHLRRLRDHGQVYPLSLPVPRPMDRPRVPGQLQPPPRRTVWTHGREEGVAARAKQVPLLRHLGRVDAKGAEDEVEAPALLLSFVLEGEKEFFFACERKYYRKEKGTTWFVGPIGGCIIPLRTSRWLTSRKKDGRM